MSIYDTGLTLAYCVAVAFIFGACMGSFLNCTAIRIGRGENFVKGRSHCMSCGHDLYLKDLIPIVSWLALKGRCRYCHEKVSGRYVLVEVIFALLTVCCLLKFDLTILCLRNYIFISVLYLLTLTDIDTMTIPDGCHIIAVIAWAATSLMMYGKSVMRRYQAPCRSGTVLRIYRYTVRDDNILHTGAGIQYSGKTKREGVPVWSLDRNGGSDRAVCRRTSDKLVLRSAGNIAGRSTEKMYINLKERNVRPLLTDK